MACDAGQGIGADQSPAAFWGVLTVVPSWDRHPSCGRAHISLSGQVTWSDLLYTAGQRTIPIHSNRVKKELYPAPHG